MAEKASPAATVSSLLDSQQQLAASGASMVDNHLPVNLNNNCSINNNNTSSTTTNDHNKNSNNSSNKEIQASSGSSQSSQKRPMNAFLIFCKRHRSVVKSKYPHLENRSITKILGEWWAALDGEQKQTYTELARQYKEAFMKANPHFKWYKTDSFITAAPHHQTNSSPVMSSSSSTESSKRTIIGTTNATASVVGETNITQHKSSKDSTVIVSENSSLKENKVGNPTPKPPKKRYLETSEFKATVAASSSVTSVTAAKAEGTTPSNIPTPVSIQPVLDVATMSRIIVDALDGGPNPPPSSYLNMTDIKTAAGVSLDSPSRSPSSPERVVLNGHVGGQGIPHSPPQNGVMVNGVVSSMVGIGVAVSSESSVSSLTAKSLLIAESQQPIGSATAAITAAIQASSAKTSLPISMNNAHMSSHAVSSQSISVPSVDDDDEMMDEEQDDDKPLNLSSSKVLRASNQQIIDHFIDKLLTTGGECGEGNPMPVEMMEHTSSLPVSVTATTTSKNKKGNKRFNHEMNSEVSMKSMSPSSEPDERGGHGSHLLSNVGNNNVSNAGNVSLVNGGSSSTAKRPKSNSMSSSGSSSSTTSSHGMTEGGDNHASPVKSAGGSKWVSGEFDLEERIAALPQLQDTHLINALNHKSSERLIAINGSRASSHNNHHHSSQPTPVSVQSAIAAAMEVGPCDGLAALAEVALSQAKQAITTSSSS